MINIVIKPTIFLKSDIVCGAKLQAQCIYLLLFKSLSLCTKGVTSVVTNAGTLMDTSQQPLEGLYYNTGT
jgi:hypothetical protein